jgi:hypothetical protein
MSPTLAAVCRYQPSPGSWKRWFPSVNRSAAIRKNHPPAQLIIEFQISGIMPKGSSRRLKRRQAFR